MSEQHSKDHTQRVVCDSSNAILLEIEDNAELSTRPCTLWLAPAVPLTDGTFTVVEFESGEEDTTIRPLSPELLAKIRAYKPRVRRELRTD